MNPVFTFEGNIGSGKSTLLKKLEQNNMIKNVVYLQEPVDIWNTIKDNKGETILEKFYKNQVKYSFSFQIMAYISRLSQLKVCIKNNPNKIILSERSILTDKNIFAKMLFDDGKIEDINYKIYLKWFDEFISEFNFKGIVYLKTSPENCNRRIKERNRKGENNISIEYSKKCNQYHENWLNNINHNKLILDGNINFKNKIPNEWYDLIQKFIK